MFIELGGVSLPVLQGVVVVESKMVVHSSEGACRSGSSSCYCSSCSNCSGRRREQFVAAKAPGLPGARICVLADEKTDSRVRCVLRKGKGRSRFRSPAKQKQSI